MNTSFPSPSGVKSVRSQGTGFVWSLILSIIIAVLCMSVVLTLAGAWDFLAVTRLLDLLIEGGFIQYHDANRGFIAGLPNVELYYFSQDPLDWRLIVLGAAFMVIYPAIKAIQFHVIARIFGSSGTIGQHARAYFYGDGLDRFLPFNIGRVGMATVLTKYGLSRREASGAVFMSHAFTLFEVISFALIGLFMFGWMGWFSQIFWALVVLGFAYLLVAPVKLSPLGSLWNSLGSAGRALGPLARAMPVQLVQLCVLSLLAFGALDLASYVLMSAFETDIVLIGIDPPLLLLGLVGGYIASRFVTVTPGGIGQWELGFATGLVLSGAQSWLPLVVIAVMVNVTRIVMGILMMAVVMLRYGVPTSLGEVFSEAMRTSPPERSPDAIENTGDRSPAAVE